MAAATAIAARMMNGIGWIIKSPQLNQEIRN
jgi:hypothetical protein